MIKIPTKKQYESAKKTVELYEKYNNVDANGMLDPKRSDHLVKLLTGKNVGDSFSHYFAYHKGYRNDFEGYCDNPGTILGINTDGNRLILNFREGGLFSDLSRTENISYKYINQSTEDYVEKYNACSDKEFILRIISEQCFQHFISWYGPSYKKNCTNMYRTVDDVIDDWNDFVRNSTVNEEESKYILKIFEEFHETFYDEMPVRMIERVGTDEVLYKRTN